MSDATGWDDVDELELVHYARAKAVREARGHVLDAAYLAIPERFVQKPPVPPQLPEAAWINKPDDKKEPAASVSFSHQDELAGFFVTL